MNKNIFIIIFGGLLYFISNAFATNHCGPSDVKLFRSISVLSKLGNRNFSAACYAHDQCYDRCGVKQKHCDRQFLRDLENECKRAYSGNNSLKYICKQITASFYFGLVNDIGESIYLKSQKEVCDIPSQIGKSTKSKLYRFFLSGVTQIRNTFFSLFG